MPSSPDLAGPFRLLHCSFWGAIVSFALAMYAQQWLTTHPPPLGLSAAAITSATIAVFCVFAIGYWWSLGVLAHRTGRSTALWVVVGLATLAIGFFVTYALMWRNVRATARPHSSRT